MDHPTKAKLDSHDEDRISGLPDEFIASILSRLTLKEAQATSILSKRWRYLWISHATHLDFDFNQGLEMSRAKFVEVVDKVLRQYSLRCDRSLHRFSVDYVFLTKHKSCIVRWIRFALSKQVKEIELRLLDVHFGIVPKEYMLSSDVFTDAGGVVETLQPNSGHIPLGYRSYGSSWTVGFRYLKHLVLKYVSIEGKFIDYLLANCSVLERLVFVNCSVSKSKLRISGQSLKLKVLYIERCSNFTDIEINDVNLVSLTYRGRELPLRVDNVPQLVELWIGEWLPVTPGHAILDGLSSSISHVQILKLEFYYMEGMLIPKLPTLRNVMQLKITLDAIEDSSLLLFTPLIEACPNLLRFTLKILGWWEASTVEKREERRIVGIPFRCLELVEFCGCYGRSSHYELVQYFIKNAVALRKLVVDPRIEPEVEYEDSYPHVKPDSEEYEDSEEDDQEVERQSREHAKQQLEGKLPSRIELMIC